MYRQVETMQADRLRHISMRNIIQTTKAGNKTRRGQSPKYNHYASQNMPRLFGRKKKGKMGDELSLEWIVENNKNKHAFWLKTTFLAMLYVVKVWRSVVRSHRNVVNSVLSILIYSHYHLPVFFFFLI